MKKSTTNRLIALIMLSAFVLTLFLTPVTARAAWDDKSDELPGMHEFPTTLVIIAGVAVVAGTILLLSKNKDKSDDEAVKTDEKTAGAIENSEQTIEERPDSTQVIENEQEISFKELLNAPEQELSNVKFYIGLDQVDETFSSKLSQPGFADVQLNVGFMLSF